MSKITIIEGNSNEKDNTRAYMVKGEKGEKGDANTLSIGTVEETETASATITGTAPNQTLNLGLPKADPNTLSIGTVTKGADASATITGDAPNQTLNLVLPKGDKGDAGASGYEVPAGSVIGWDSSNSIPSGYEEVDNPFNYVTTEQKIGTWINGKPLYRKAVTISVNHTASTSVVSYDTLHNIANVETIFIDKNASFDNMNVTLDAIYPSNTGSVYYFRRVEITTTKISIRMRYNDNDSFTALVFVCYTKTTD